jgi:hypothetical protein
MILGMSLHAFTVFHVALSLIGILTGFIVVFGMFGAKRMNGMTVLFLLTTVLTDVTAFMFPNDHITPGIILGIISSVFLVVAIIARYGLHLSGGARGIYAVTAVFSLYTNFFALIAQSFGKIPALHSLAPTGKEPPFFIAQGIALVLFVVFAIIAAKKFRPATN